MGNPIILVNNEKLENSIVLDIGDWVTSYAGMEGVLSGLQIRINQLVKEDKNIYDNFVKFSVETWELPQYRDATDHIHIVVRK